MVLFKKLKVTLISQKYKVCIKKSNYIHLIILLECNKFYFKYLLMQLISNELSQVVILTVLPCIYDYNIL